jgi:hypothetical protein
MHPNVRRDLNVEDASFDGRFAGAGVAEIRQQPGCSSVRDVAINHVTDDRAESNWSLSVVSAGAADARSARRGAIYVQHALRHDYELMTD